MNGLTQFCYRVTALDDVPGETFASPENCITTGNSGSNANTVTVSWAAVLGATGYNIYGRATSTETLMTSVGAVTTFLDDDLASPAPDGSTYVPTANSTQLVDPSAPNLNVTVAPGLTPGQQYCYRITALDTNIPAGETRASTSTCITLTGGQNMVNVTWGAVIGASGYNIYGRTLGSEYFLANVVGVLTTTYQDNGSASPITVPPTPPPATNTTSRGLITNSFHDDIRVTAGAASAKSTLSFNE